MQTFLPWPDFAASATALDDRRLGKQRVETLQILRALHVPDYGWASHPAVTMWRGYTEALVAYGIAVIDEWTRRGKADRTRGDITEFVHPQDPPSQTSLASRGRLPAWLGDEELHRSHRSNLLRKDPDHYRPLFPDDPVDLGYVWPDPLPVSTSASTPDAWVLRAEVTDDRVSLPIADGDTPWVPLDARSGRITKRLRQVARFVDEVREGDRVLCLTGDGLTVAVADEYRRGAEHHHRLVTVVGELPRSALDFPAALQDPQQVFLVADEPALRAFPGRSPAPAPR